MKATFSMSLEGPALSGSSMEVRQLGPALSELGELCARANAVLNRDQSTLTIRWQQETEPSTPSASKPSAPLSLSFAVRRRREGATPNLFSTDDATDTKRLLQLLGFQPASDKSMSLLELLHWLDGETPSQIEEVLGGWLRVEASGRSTEVSSRVVSLLRDAAVRGRIEGLLRPLRRKGIERIVFHSAGRIATAIDRKSIKRFAQPSHRIQQTDGETLVDSTYLRALGIVKVPFRPNLKWVLGSEGERISAAMRDPAFLDRHQDGLTSYAAGDILTVRLHTTAVRTPSGLRTDHTIVEVIGHLSRAQEAQQTSIDQLPLDTEDTAS